MFRGRPPVSGIFVAALGAFVFSGLVGWSMSVALTLTVVVFIIACMIWWQS